MAKQSLSVISIDSTVCSLYCWNTTNLSYCVSFLHPHDPVSDQLHQLHWIFHHTEVHKSCFFTANWRSCLQRVNPADWVYIRLHHSSLPIPCKRRWQVVLLWRHAPIFLPDAGSIRNGTQITSSDPELQEEYYGMDPMQAGRGWGSSVTMQCRQASIHFYATYVYTQDHTH